MRRTTVVIATALVSIVGASGIRLLRPHHDSTPEPIVAAQSVPAPRYTALETAASTSAPATTGAGSEHGVGESPTHAALRFLNLDEQLFPAVSSEKARALMESIAAAPDRVRLGIRAAEHQRQILAKGDLAGLTLRLAPIVARARECSATSCTVDVYYLLLWSFPGKGALDDYATAEIHMVREGEEWRLHDSSMISGPYPAGRYSARPSSLSTASRFESALDGFTDTEVTP